MASLNLSATYALYARITQQRIASGMMLSQSTPSFKDQTYVKVSDRLRFLHRQHTPCIYTAVVLTVLTIERLCEPEIYLCLRWPWLGLNCHLVTRESNQGGLDFGGAPGSVASSSEHLDFLQLLCGQLKDHLKGLRDSGIEDVQVL